MRRNKHRSRADEDDGPSAANSGGSRRHPPIDAQAGSFAEHRRAAVSDGTSRAAGTCTAPAAVADTVSIRDGSRGSKTKRLSRWWPTVAPSLLAITALSATAVLAIVCLSSPYESVGHFLDRKSPASKASSGGGARTGPNAAAAQQQQQQQQQQGEESRDGWGRDRRNSSGDKAESAAADGASIDVFIGIKTSERGVHGERMSQIQKTWLRDALDMGVEVKFFTHGAENVGAGHSVVGGNETTHGGAQPLVVPTACSYEDLCCKTSATFAYFLDQHRHGSKSTEETGNSGGRPSYFCSFDDDNYVLVRNLLQVLKSHQEGPAKGRDIYVGRVSVSKGIMIKDTRVFFLTGGAGYCLSRDLVERGRQHFTRLQYVAARAAHWTGPKVPDDVFVGYAVQEKLGVQLINDQRFHSHLEKALRKRLPRDKILEQVSFGYNNKNASASHDPIDRFPDVPIKFPAGDDPLRFRSLRCFLQQQEFGQSDSECK